MRDDDHHRAEYLDDIDVDQYPTIDVTGHHYVLVEYVDRPFVIVNNDRPRTHDDHGRRLYHDDGTPVHPSVIIFDDPYSAGDEVT